jgi:hypothetical protein
MHAMHLQLILSYSTKFDVVWNNTMRRLCTMFHGIIKGKEALAAIGIGFTPTRFS